MPDHCLLWEIKLGRSHKPTGKTHHYRGGVECSPPAELRIVQFSEDSGFYLLYIDDRGVELTDTYHETVDEAKAQAEFEFNVKPDEWNQGTQYSFRIENIDRLRS
jgi:hypothetical protein